MDNTDKKQQTAQQKQTQQQKQVQQQFQYQKKEAQKEQPTKILYSGQTSSNFEFQFETPAANREEKKQTSISEELNAAFFTQRSKEFMDILKKQEISAMSDEQIKRLIAREIVRGGATGMEDVISLKVFMDSGNTDTEEQAVTTEEQALMEEMNEDDVMDFLEMLNASFSETIAREELKLKEALVELDKKAIDESYVLARCPIYPAHDIHILPKGRHLYFCHLVNKPLSPVFEEAKRLLFSGEASMVHVYQGCAFVINAQGEVTKRIDVVDEPMELVIRNGWEELP